MITIQIFAWSRESFFIIFQDLSLKSFKKKNVSSIITLVHFRVHGKGVRVYKYHFRRAQRSPDQNDNVSEWHLRIGDILLLLSTWNITRAKVSHFTFTNDPPEGVFARVPASVRVNARARALCKLCKQPLRTLISEMRSSRTNKPYSLSLFKDNCLRDLQKYFTLFVTAAQTHGFARHSSRWHRKDNPRAQSALTKFAFLYGLSIALASSVSK